MLEFESLKTCMLQASKPERPNTNWDERNSSSDRIHTLGLLNIKVWYLWSLWCSQIKRVLEFNAAIKDLKGVAVWAQTGCTGDAKVWKRAISVNVKLEVGVESQKGSSLWQEKGEREETEMSKQRVWNIAPRQEEELKGQRREIKWWKEKWQPNSRSKTKKRWSVRVKRARERHRAC